MLTPQLIFNVIPLPCLQADTVIVQNASVLIVLKVYVSECLTKSIFWLRTLPTIVYTMTLRSQFMLLWYLEGIKYM